MKKNKVVKVLTINMTRGQLENLGYAKPVDMKVDVKYINEELTRRLIATGICSNELKARSWAQYTPLKAIEELKKKGITIVPIWNENEDYPDDLKIKYGIEARIKFDNMFGWLDNIIKWAFGKKK